MRTILLTSLMLALGACDSFSAGSVRHTTARSGDNVSESERVAQLLDGDYDNHEQAKAANLAARQASALPLRMQHSLRVVSRSATTVDWLWQARSVAANGVSAIWLMRSERKQDGSWTVTPYRANDPAYALAASVDSFKFVPAQWTALAPCVQSARWLGAVFESNADVAGCSALLSVLGAGGALLPLKFTLESDMLAVTTIADTARAADAQQLARRVRWFDGWSAINGGGPQAQANNKDWHFQQKFRISSEGSLVPIRWRDGASSGYSMILERVSYPERKLQVLQLDVVEDASGKTLAYGWSDAQATSIGLNLGWLQIGLQSASQTALIK